MGASSKLPGIGVTLATVVVSCAVLLVTLASDSAHAQAPVAGLKPDQRPEGAPRVNTFEKSPRWYQAARAGISQPFPPSLKFLEDQGGWYTPFDRRGMPGPYDIRKLHRN